MGRKMPDARKLYRFDQMAYPVKDKVHPADASVERYVGLEHLDPESLQIRRWGNPEDVDSTKIPFKAGDIIFGKRRAYQRKLAVADFDGICSAHAMVLRPKTEVVLKDFLPFFMQSDVFMDRAVKISVGGLSPTINWSDLAREEFALPPLEEQRRIAEVLQAAESSRGKFHRANDSLAIALDSASMHLLSSYACDHSVADFFHVNPETLTKAQLQSDEVWDYADLGTATFPLSLSNMEAICLADAPSRAKRIAVNGDLLVSTVRPNLKGHAFVSSLDSKVVASTGFAVLRPRKNEFASIMAGFVLSSRFLQYCEGRVSGGLYPAIRAGDVSCFPIPDLGLLVHKGYSQVFEQLLFAMNQGHALQSQYLELMRSLRNELLA
jgi:type I restriction enzyme S subunit